MHCPMVQVSYASVQSFLLSKHGRAELADVSLVYQHTSCFNLRAQNSALVLQASALPEERLVVIVVYDRRLLLL